MKVEEFFEAVDAHPDIKGLSVGEDHVKVQAPTGKYRIEVETILVSEWDDIEAILTGKRDAQALIGMTRVVGYYSRIGNFNPSKIGELKARIQGNYSFDGSKDEAARAKRMEAAEQL